MKVSFTFKRLSTIIISLLVAYTVQATPNCVTNSSPANGASVTKTSNDQYTFTWSAADPGTFGFEFRLSLNADGSSPVFTDIFFGGTETSYTLTTYPLSCNTTYYWSAVPFDGTPTSPSYADPCTFTSFMVVPAAAPTAYPSDKWSVSAYSDNTFSTYAGYYTQNNTGTSGLGLYFNTATAWASSTNPSNAITTSGVNGVGTFSVVGFSGCTFSGNTNLSYSYKRTSTLAAGNYQINIRQAVGTGNQYSFLVNGVTYLANITVNSTTIMLALPASAQLELKAVIGTVGTSSIEFRTVAVATPTTLLPGTLIADKEICYNNTGGALSATAASGGCTFNYQWQSASAFAGPYSNISGATNVGYNPGNLTATTYYKRVVTDFCGTSAETPVLTITVGPNNYAAGTINYPDLTKDTICSGSIPGAFTSITPASGGPSFVTYSYQWRAGATNIIGETNATYTPSTSISATTIYTRRMTVVGCTTTPSALLSNAITVVTQTAAGQPGTIIGSASVCVNQTGLSYSCGAIAGFTGYSWTVPTGMIISAGQGTRFLTVDTDGTYTGGTLSVVGINSCGVGVTARNLTLTLATSCVSTWNGNTSSAWRTAANWTPSGIPAASTIVVIPSGRPNMPTVSTGTNNVAALTIDLGASLTITAGTLNIYGNLTVNGTLTQTGGLVAFRGASTQTVTASTPLIVKGITLNGVGVSFASPVSLEGTVTLTQGVLTTNNNVTLKPDNGGVVAFVNGNTGTVSGNVTVVKAMANGFRYISSPLVGVMGSDLSDDMTVVSGSLSRMSAWDYSIPGFKAQTAIGSVPLGSANAVKLFVPAGGISADFTGTINNTGSFTSSVISNSTANNDLFVGNPYPSYLNIDAATGWSFSGVGNTFYFWNASSNSFSTYQKGSPGVGANGGTSIIPMFQGFFLKTTGAGGSASVTMGPRIRSTTSQGLYRTTLSDENLSFKVTASASTNSDETIIRLSDNGTIAYDDTLDAFKFTNPSTSINLYTMGDGNEYVINTLPASTYETIVPMSVKVPTSGTYSLSLPSSSNYTVVVIDKKESVEKVADGLDYVFTADPTDNADRFDVVFRTSATTATKASSTFNSNVSFASTGEKLVVIAKNPLSNATVSVYNTVGALVLEVPNTSITSGANVLNNVNLESGAYIIKISTSDVEYTGHATIVK